MLGFFSFLFPCKQKREEMGRVGEGEGREKENRCLKYKK
jgi:hypothetical protein